MYAYAAKAKDLKVQIRTIASKADVTVVEEEEEGEEEEESEESKKARLAAEAAAKAAETAAAAAAKKGESPGNQADKQDKETGNQADSALKATLDSVQAQMKSITDALNGVSTLQTTVSGLFDVVAGKKPLTDLAPPQPLSLMKGSPAATIDALATAVEDAIETSRFDAAAAMRARSLLGRADAVIKGVIPEQQFLDELKVAPHMVQQVFAAAMPKKAA
jgi:hypothetical protein